MADVANRTKVCCHCGEPKPVSEFYFQQGRPGGPCKPCAKAVSIAWQKAHPDAKREFDRRHRERVKANPERAAVLADQKRESKRRRLGIRPENYRTTRAFREKPSGPHEMLALAPFAAWLRTLGRNSEDIAAACDIDPGQVRAYLRDERGGVHIDTVDHACLTVGVSIDAVYSEVP